MCGKLVELGAGWHSVCLLLCWFYVSCRCACRFHGRERGCFPGSWLGRGGSDSDDGAIHRATGAKLQTVRNVSILLCCCLVSFYLPLVTVHTEGCALLKLFCCAIHRIYCRIPSSLVADTEQWVTSPGPCLAEGSGIAVATNGQFVLFFFYLWGFEGRSPLFELSCCLSCVSVSLPLLHFHLHSGSQVKGVRVGLGSSVGLGNRLQCPSILECSGVPSLFPRSALGRLSALPDCLRLLTC